MVDHGQMGCEYRTESGSRALDTGRKSKQTIHTTRPHPTGTTLLGN